MKVRVKTPLKNEGTFIRLRRYLHRLTKVSSSAHEGTFVKMAEKTHRLEIAAKEFMQKYIGRMSLHNVKNEVDTKQTVSFRKQRGVMSSDKPYKETLEEALIKKYSV